MSSEVTPPNPYDFIFDDKKHKKKSLFSGGGKKERIMIVAAGAIGLVAAIAIAIGIISSTGADNSDEDLITIATQQAELVRIATIGTEKSRSSTTQNYAFTVKAAIETDQATTTTLLTKAHLKADPSVIALGKNTKTDQALTLAQQTNQFDDAFTQQIHIQLQAYQQTLSKIYESTSNKTTKAQVKTQYEHASALLPTAAETQ